MKEKVTHEALDDEPTIRVSVEDLSRRDETDSTGGLK